ncbi:hypothetical protein IJJ18_03450 [Candidatus Saccharibacteria bacterium]|nr:hypothetical protein [Candidatus Saccharibacteria bacterium]
MISGVGGAVCDRTSRDDDTTEKQARILQVASKVCQLISGVVTVTLVLCIFANFGFSWFIFAGLATVVTLRATSIVVATLWAGHDAKPLPKWFDFMMYEALVAGVLITPSLIIGAAVAIF